MNYVHLMNGSFLMSLNCFVKLDFNFTWASSHTVQLVNGLVILKSAKRAPYLREILKLPRSALLCQLPLQIKGKR